MTRRSACRRGTSGSRVGRELDRLAREAEFKRRIGAHVRTFVEDRCPDSVEIRHPRDE
jgi:hypothetical protein